MSDPWNDDAPTVSLISDTTQRARKAYTCDTCPLPGAPRTNVIPKGQMYRRERGAIDGEIYVVRRCVGGCPHTADCPSCKGRGTISEDDRLYADPCPSCDGAGKARAALASDGEASRG